MESEASTRFGRWEAQKAICPRERDDSSDPTRLGKEAKSWAALTIRNQMALGSL